MDCTGTVVWGRRGSRRASSYFHWIASFFYLQSRYEPAPIERFNELRQNGHSVSRIAKLTGITPSKVRRIVGKLDPEKVGLARQRQGETAVQIAGLPIPWPEKISLWKEQTGQCGATLWRVLKKYREAEAVDKSLPQKE